MTSPSTAGIRVGQWFVLPALTLFILDLWTKAWAFGWLGTDVHFIAGQWLGFVKVYNPGGAFGLGQNFTTPLTLVRVAAVAVLFMLAFRQRTKICLLTLGLLAGGALGNLYDNLSRWLPWQGNGMVRDFLLVDLGPAPGWWPEFLPWVFNPWPIFNLADSCITIGFLLLVFGVAKVKFHAHDAGN